MARATTWATNISVHAEFEEGSGLGTLTVADLTNLNKVRSLGAPIGISPIHRRIDLDHLDDPGLCSVVRVGCLSVDRASACLRHGLAILTLCRGRQLQHCGGLVGDQPSDFHNPAVRKFESIVMGVRIFHIYLPKPRDPVIYTPVPEKV
jgi:hypothetical protein